MSRVPRIGIITADGERFDVETKILAHSAVIDRHIKSHPELDDMGYLLEGAEPIHLLRTSSDVFQKILDWLNVHSDEKPMREPNMSLLPQGYHAEPSFSEKSPESEVEPAETEELAEVVIIKEKSKIVPRSKELPKVPTTFLSTTANNQSVLLEWNEPNDSDFDEIPNENNNELDVYEVEENQQPIKDFHDAARRFRMVRPQKIDIATAPVPSEYAAFNNVREWALRRRLISESAVPSDSTMSDSLMIGFEDEDAEFSRALKVLEEADRNPIMFDNRTSTYHASELALPDWDLEFFKSMSKSLLVRVLNASSTLQIHRLRRNACIFVALKMGDTADQALEFFNY